MSSLQAPLSYRKFDPDGLKFIAGRQRWLAVCLLAYIAAIAVGVYFLLAILPGRQHLLLPFILVWGAIAWTFLILAIVMTYGLIKRLHSPLIAVICAILTLVPYIGLCIPVYALFKARRELKAHGIKAGFLGAKEKIN